MPKKTIHVRSHKRRLPSGKTTNVKAHTRNINSVRKYRNYKRSTLKINPESLDPGDFILLKNSKKSLVPGNFDHVILYAGKVQKNEKVWDRDKNEYMAPGTHYVIHSTRKTGDGLGYSSLETILKDAKKIKPLEVSNLSLSEKAKSVEYLKDQLTGKSGKPVGPKYNLNWFSKRETPKERKGFYCSEAVWSAYKNCCNIDLDPNKDQWKWNRAHGVAPDDLLEAKSTRIIDA
jgi:cell wall-associated NlpC family hydrolase